MAGRKFRISPIEDEVSFRQLQKKHDHFIKFGNFVVFPTHNNHSAGTQYVKGIPFSSLNYYVTVYFPTMLTYVRYKYGFF
jgi:hypothetical protein